MDHDPLLTRGFVVHYCSAVYKKLVANSQRRAGVGDPKNHLGSLGREAEVQRLKEQFGFSQRHACELIQIPRSTCRYASRRDDGALRQKLVVLPHEQRRYGLPAVVCTVAAGGDGGEREAGAPGVPGRGIAGAADPPAPADAQCSAASGAHGSQSGVGFGLRQRRDGRRETLARVERERHLHAGMFGAGDRHELSKPPCWKRGSHGAAPRRECAATTAPN